MKFLEKTACQPIFFDILILLLKKFILLIISNVVS